MKTKISTQKAPAAIGPYSQGVDIGSMVYTSGQLGIDPATATRDRLAAQDLNDIVEWSHGLYKIPAKFLAE